MSGENKFNDGNVAFLPTLKRGPPGTGDGGGGTIDGMEARVAVLEAVVPTLATKADVKAEIADVRSDIHKAVSELTRWIVGTTIAGIAVFVTLMTFVLNNAVPKQPPASTAAPIIITLPAPLPAAEPASKAPKPP